MEIQDAKSAILVHVNSGKILYEKNMHQRLTPASLTKMMTMLLALELIRKGRVKWTDRVTISERVAKTNTMVAALKEGERFSVEELMRLYQPSCNRAFVALAECLAGGTQEDFVVMMNAKAQELGMTNTRFVNAHGLAGVSRHYSTAYDMALLSMALIKVGGIFRISTMKQVRIMRGSGKSQTYKATNPLLGVYSGVDGLKTGYLSGIGYHLSATLRRGKHRFVAVVMETTSREKSGEECAMMFDYALSLPEYQEKTLTD